jgi:eukaryotic translation initiation factor 2C
METPSKHYFFIMPPKKGKAPPALSQKEMKYITNNMANFVQNPTEKNAHFKTLGPKRNTAEKLFDQLKDSGKYSGGSSDPAASVPPASPTPPESPALPTNADSENEVQSPGDQVADAAAGGTASSTQVTTPVGKGEELVIRENTGRTMPQGRAGLRNPSLGKLLKVEDMDVVVNLQDLHAKAPPFPIRENFQNINTDIFTNRFRVFATPGAILHEFEIVGIPDGGSRRVKKSFVDTAIEKSTVLNNNQDIFATDYNKTIITWKNICKDLTENARLDSKEVGWHLVDIKDGDNRVLKLYLKYIREVDTENLQRYVKSDPGDDYWNPLTWNKDTVLNALNIVVSKCLGGGALRLGANKFFIEAGNTPLGNSPLTAIRGYFYSIQPGMGEILLNVNACTSAFLQPVTLDVLLNNQSKTLFGRDWPSFLIGLRVYIDYNRGSTSKAKASAMNKDESRIKKICGLGKPCNKQTFVWKRRDDEGDLIGEEKIDVARYLESGRTH